MHERAGVTRALAELIESLDRDVQRVHAVVGPGVDLDVVRQAWDSAAAGTVVERAVLDCEPVGDLLRCLACEAEYAGDKLTPCPECDGIGLVIRRAPEFAVQAWEIA